MTARKEGAGLRIMRFGAPKPIPRRAPANSRRLEVAEIIRALMDGPKTVDDLLDFVDMSEEIVRLWLQAFHESGIVRLTARRPQVYAIQSKPFAQPDVPTRDQIRMQRGMRVEA